MRKPIHESGRLSLLPKQTFLTIRQNVFIAVKEHNDIVSVNAAEFFVFINEPKNTLHLKTS